MLNSDLNRLKRDEFILKIKDILLSAIICASKRGTMTTDFLARTQEHLSTELGYGVSLFEQERMRELGRLMSFGFDTIEHVREFFGRLQGYFAPEFMSLRVRLILERAGYSGIGGYKIIDTAFKLFNNFRWDLIGKILPTEWQNFVQSVGIIGDDMYFGFVNANQEHPWNVRRICNLIYFSIYFLKTKGGAEYQRIGQYGQYKGQFAESALLKGLVRVYKPDAEDLENRYHTDFDPPTIIAIANLMVEYYWNRNEEIPSTHFLKTTPIIQTVLRENNIDINNIVQRRAAEEALRNQCKCKLFS